MLAVGQDREAWSAGWGRDLHVPVDHAHQDSFQIVPSRKCLEIRQVRRPSPWLTPQTQASVTCEATMVPCGGHGLACLGADRPAQTAGRRP